jgi:hypothetical protein
LGNNELHFAGERMLLCPNLGTQNKGRFLLASGMEASMFPEYIAVSEEFDRVDLCFGFLL